jgi:hypothetical protein
VKKEKNRKWRKIINAVTIKYHELDVSKMSYFYGVWA